MIPFLEADVLCAVSVVGGITGLALIAKWSGHSVSSKHSKEILTRCKDLVNQASENFKMSQQCESSLFALRYATHAVSYLNSARILVSDDAIQKSTGIDVHETVRLYENTQRRLVTKMAKSCPASAPSGQAAPSVTWL